MRSIAELLTPSFTREVLPALMVHVVRSYGSIDAETRREVYRRDRGRCRYCGEAAATAHRPVGEIDHIKPRLYGGTNALNNLALACQPCNGRKNGRVPDEAGMRLRPIVWPR